MHFMGWMRLSVRIRRTALVPAAAALRDRALIPDGGAGRGANLIRPTPRSLAS